MYVHPSNCLQIAINCHIRLAQHLFLLLGFILFFFFRKVIKVPKNHIYIFKRTNHARSRLKKQNPRYPRLRRNIIFPLANRADRRYKSAYPLLPNRFGFRGSPRSKRDTKTDKLLSESARGERDRRRELFWVEKGRDDDGGRSRRGAFGGSDERGKGILEGGATFALRYKKSCGGE